jgi:hypothetical protein
MLVAAELWKGDTFLKSGALLAHFWHDLSSALIFIASAIIL